jgi:hypothetical protein
MVELKLLKMEKKKTNNAVDELFTNALKETIESTIHENKTVEIVQETLSIEQKAFEATVVNTEDKWVELKTMMNNEFAEKAMGIIKALPDLQFLSAFFKMQEFVNPKLVRKEKLEGKTEHKKIEITITKRNDRGETETKKI